MELLTVKDVAKRVGVNHRFVYAEIQEGRLRALKLGTPGAKRPTIRVERSAYEAWLSNAGQDQ